MTQIVTGKYNIDFDKLSRTLLPFSLRKDNLINLLFVFLAPLRRMYNEFLAFREEKEYRMRHSGQVCSLEAILNDESPLNGIYITDGVYTEEFLIPPDGSTAYASYQVYLSADGEDATQTYLPAQLFTTSSEGDFIIHLPAGLQANIYADVRNRLIALADMYKIIGKRYTIVYE